MRLDTGQEPGKRPDITEMCLAFGARIVPAKNIANKDTRGRLLFAEGVVIEIGRPGGKEAGLGKRLVGVSTNRVNLLRIGHVSNPQVVAVSEVVPDVVS